MPTRQEDKEVAGSDNTHPTVAYTVTQGDGVVKGPQFYVAPSPADQDRMEAKEVYGERLVQVVRDERGLMTRPKVTCRRLMTNNIL